MLSYPVRKTSSKKDAYEKSMVVIIINYLRS